MCIAETIKYKNHKIEICQDEDPINPRDEWDNLGKLLCWHKRYILGDYKLMEDSIKIKNEDYIKLKNLPNYYHNWHNIKETLIKYYDIAVIAPVYLYDHSGLRIKIDSFQGLLPQGHAEFDSMQIGFIFITKKDLLNEFSKKKISKSIINKAHQILEDEIKNYDDYLSGNVWGFRILDNKNEIIDSCWTFFGDSKYCIQDAKHTIDSIIENKIKKHLEVLKGYIENKVPLIYRKALMI